VADTVPYRGANPAMQDLISGRVDYLRDIITTAKPQIDGGTVKAIAILTRQRSPALPDVPTAIEQGFDVEAYTWNGFFLPRGTPDAIVQKLNHATVEAMKTPEVRAKLESAGLQLSPPIAPRRTISPNSCKMRSQNGQCRSRPAASASIRWGKNPWNRSS
jgi:tripartite-type tricarboxylate transporter receptor subunit TctC